MATWYAKATANWDAHTLLVSDVWNSNANPLAGSDMAYPLTFFDGDIVEANGYTVALNVDAAEELTLQNTLGGGFSVDQTTLDRHFDNSLFIAKEVGSMVTATTGTGKLYIGAADNAVGTTFYGVNVVVTGQALTTTFKAVDCSGSSDGYTLNSCPIVTITGDVDCTTSGTGVVILSCPIVTITGDVDCSGVSGGITLSNCTSVIVYGDVDCNNSATGKTFNTCTSVIVYGDVDCSGTSNTFGASVAVVVFGGTISNSNNATGKLLGPTSTITTAPADAILVSSGGNIPDNTVRPPYGTGALSMLGPWPVSTTHIGPYPVTDNAVGPYPIV